MRVHCKNNDAADKDTWLFLWQNKIEVNPKNFLVNISINIMISPISKKEMVLYLIDKNGWT